MRFRIIIVTEQSRNFEMLLCRQGKPQCGFVPEKQMLGTKGDSLNWPTERDIYGAIL